MFNEELRDMILSDIAKSDQHCTVIQKQNKRILKLLITNGVEETFVKGSIKLSKYKDTVNSMTTLFNAYHSGYTYEFIGKARKRKISQCILDRISKIGAVGILLEGLIKPWELTKTIKSVLFLSQQTYDNPKVKELSSMVQNDPNQFMPLSCKDFNYPGIPSKRQQTERTRAKEIEDLKNAQDSSSSSSEESII